MATPFLGRRGSLGSGDTLPLHLSSPRLHTDVSPHSGAGPANPGAASLCPPGPARSSLLSPPPLTPSGAGTVSCLSLTWPHALACHMGVLRASADSGPGRWPWAQARAGTPSCNLFTSHI